MVSECKQIINFRDAYQMNDQSIIFSAVEMNGLFVQKPDDNQAELLCKFPEEDEIQDNLHSQIVAEDETTVYFIPLEGRGISKYNIVTKKLKNILFKEVEHCLFIRAFLIGKDIFLIPMNSSSHFCIFHTENETYEILCELENEIWKYISPAKYWLDPFSVTSDGRILYIAPSEGNQILYIDVWNHKVDKKEIKENIGISSMVHFEGKLYLYSAGLSAFMEYDLRKEALRNLLCGGDKKEELILVEHKGKIISVTESNIISFDPAAGKKEFEIAIPDNFKIRNSKYKLLAGKREIENQLWIMSASGSGTLKILNQDCHSDESYIDNCFTRKIIEYGKERRKRSLRVVLEAKEIVIEKDFEAADLENYIDVLLS